jgi:hypothetical protein
MIGDIQKNSTMAKSPPPPRLPDLVPHEVSQDSSFDVIDNHPLPFVLDASLTDQTAAGTEAIFTMSGCNNNFLKVCIVAASVSVWGIRNMFLAQLDAVYQLLHPMRPNHLAVIQQTGLSGGSSSSSFLCSCSPWMECLSSRAPTLALGPS